MAKRITLAPEAGATTTRAFDLATAIKLARAETDLHDKSGRATAALAEWLSAEGFAPAHFKRPAQGQNHGDQYTKLTQIGLAAIRVGGSLLSDATIAKMADKNVPGDTILVRKGKGATAKEYSKRYVSQQLGPWRNRIAAAVATMDAANGKDGNGGNGANASGKTAEQKAAERLQWLWNQSHAENMPFAKVSDAGKLHAAIQQIAEILGVKIKATK